VKTPTPIRPARFTLIELLIALAIVGIMAAIAIPQLLGSRTKALKAKCDEMAHALDGELVMEAQKAMDLKASNPSSPEPAIMAMATVAGRHHDQSPALRGKKPVCNDTNRWGYQNDCMYLAQFFPQGLQQVPGLLRPQTTRTRRTSRSRTRTSTAP
jgi:prepilin-type N-terminal cleavage/methylation domain-containing protein